MSSFKSFNSIVFKISIGLSNLNGFFTKCLSKAKFLNNDLQRVLSLVV